MQWSEKPSEQTALSCPNKLSKNSYKNIILEIMNPMLALPQSPGAPQSKFSKSHNKKFNNYVVTKIGSNFRLTK